MKRVDKTEGKVVIQVQILAKGIKKHIKNLNDVGKSYLISLLLN